MCCGLRSTPQHLQKALYARQRIEADNLIMEDHYYAVIMAGGGGTRLWPLSRQSRPKQMLRLIDERRLFQTSVQRLEGVFPPERILVVTVEEQDAERALKL